MEKIEENNIKIYIACHKDCEVPSDDIYTPIQVGRKVASSLLDMAGDDTGDNISDKNPSFCETTAQYWVWKNVHDVDYVGFCHYRRFFKIASNKRDQLNSIFSSGIDLVLPSPQYRLYTMQHTILVYVCSDDISILKSVIHRMYPDYDEAFDKYMMGVVGYPYNMMICSKKLFDEYASWLFSILFECERLIKPSPYTRGKRVFGYMAELLMPIYFYKNKCKIKYLDVVFKDGEQCYVQKTRWQDKVKGLFVSFWMKNVFRYPYLYDRAHIKSLRNDGIEI